MDDKLTIKVKRIQMFCMDKRLEIQFTLPVLVVEETHGVDENE